MKTTLVYRSRARRELSKEKKKRKQRKFPKTRTDNLHYTATQFPKYNRERLIFM